DYQTASRLRLKRSLLDQLAQSYDFAVPPGMVELEFDNIWQQHEAEKERAAQSETSTAEAATASSQEAGAQAALEVNAGTEESVAEGAPSEAGIADIASQADDREPSATEHEEALRADYRRIAERRVRLGLLLAEVGRSNNITVTQEELNQAITR